MKAGKWLIGWLILVFSALFFITFWVIRIDPFFHYHKPYTDRYFYSLDNQRCQNDGISKHFDYDAMITGTSMTENFKTSEMDRIFGCHSIKVAYSGGTFKEINDNVVKAIEANPKLQTVIRGLDTGKFLSKWDEMRTDLGDYPSYLYDNNPFNDLEYLWNRDVVFGRAYQMSLSNNEEGFQPGITSFDEYSCWQSRYSFGIDSVCPKGITTTETEQTHLSEKEKQIIEENVHRNLVSVAEQYPEIDFYYFYTPYSVVAWNNWKKAGTMIKMLEAEAYITDLIIPHENIHLYSFNSRTDITSDLNNYKDEYHYASWINSLILKWMHEGTYQLTKENYKSILQQEYDFYVNFDYSSINDQEDYSYDYYAAALLNKELTGAAPVDVLKDDRIEIEYSQSELMVSDDETPVIQCRGSLSRDYLTQELSAYLRDREYIGAKFSLSLDKGYHYLSFTGQKIQNHGSLIAYVFDSDGNVLESLDINYPDLDTEKHTYLLDLSDASGTVTVILNGGYRDSSGSSDSVYQFSNIIVY